MFKIQNPSTFLVAELTDGLNMPIVYKDQQGNFIYQVSIKQLDQNNYILVSSDSSGCYDEILLDATEDDIIEWAKFQITGWGEDCNEEEKEKFITVIKNSL